MDQIANHRPVSLAEFLTKTNIPRGVSAEVLEFAALSVAGQHQSLKDAAAKAFPDEKPWGLNRKKHVAQAAIAERDKILSGKA